ncbi:MAG: (cytosine-5)-methyltransferase 1 [Pseudomonadota bacterium]|nr:(cytosine-5)-methyltransferase 1 [Pseudomonadota bacterium]
METIKNKTVRFIDLFAGLGGTRLGFEQACSDFNFDAKCVFSSEIKEHAILAYKQNFHNEEIHGDITIINPQNIPDFDYLLAGFPCQPFSSAGKRNGFMDERGGLFFIIHNILKIKKPKGFLLENVDGLVNHDNGNTLKTILDKLQELKYNVSWDILDASEFGVPQKRRRVYIVGHKKYAPNLKGYNQTYKLAGLCIDEDLDFTHSKFTKLLSDKFKKEFLYGKSIKDKRGGINNIHSWDLEIKGKVTKKQAYLLEQILLKRRNKKWAVSKGIEWMDGMPLTVDEIRTFCNYPKLDTDLEDLANKGYLKYEHPKQLIIENGISRRVARLNAPKGYNIVAGKLSFPIAKIINPNDYAPTIVATEAGKIAVATDKGVRPISIREGLRFSGFPESYTLDALDYLKAYDLIGNTVMPPVIKFVSSRVLKKD